MSYVRAAFRLPMLPFFVLGMLAGAAYFMLKAGWLETKG